MQDAVRWLNQPEPRKLKRPFGRRIAQAGDTDATRQTTFNGSLDQTWRDKRQRDRHVDVTNAAMVALRDLFQILHGARNDLSQPLPSACDGLKQSGSSLSRSWSNRYAWARRRQ